MLEIREINLVDCIVSITKQGVGLKNGEYVFIETHNKVSKSILDEAEALRVNTNTKYRIEDINAKAGEIISNKYPITKQLNYPRGTDVNVIVSADTTVGQMYGWIDNVRAKSDLAIENQLTVQEFVDSLNQ